MVSGIGAQRRADLGLAVQEPGALREAGGNDDAVPHAAQGIQVAVALRGVGKEVREAARLAGKRGGQGRWREEGQGEEQRDGAARSRDAARVVTNGGRSVQGPMDRTGGEPMDRDEQRAAAPRGSSRRVRGGRGRGHHRRLWPSGLWEVRPGGLHRLGRGLGARGALPPAARDRAARPGCHPACPAPPARTRQPSSSRRSPRRLQRARRAPHGIHARGPYPPCRPRLD